MLITPIDIQGNELASKFQESNYLVEELSCLTLLDVMWFSRLYNIKRIFPKLTDDEIKFLDEFVLSASIKHLLWEVDEIFQAMLDTFTEHKLEHLLDYNTSNTDFNLSLTELITDHVKTNRSMVFDSKYGDFRSLYNDGYILEVDDENNIIVDVVTDGEVDFENETFIHLSLLGDVLFVRKCKWKKS